MVAAGRPRLAALGELGVGDRDADLALDGVDRDHVAVLDQRDRAALGGLGADVADAEAAGGAGEAAVGDQRDLLAHALAVERRGGGEHLAHAGAALGALVADDDDVAFARRCASTAAKVSSSHSKTCAGPVKTARPRGMPATFTIAPSGAS